MKATVLVADSAQTVNGKVYALGLGFTDFYGSPVPPHAVIILLDVDWTETNHPIRMIAELLDGDRHPVMVQTELGEQPIQITFELEVGRPAGLPHGTPLRVPFSAQVGPLALTIGTRYEWRVTINDQQREDWSEMFTVLPPKQQ